MRPSVDRISRTNGSSFLMGIILCALLAAPVLFLAGNAAAESDEELIAQAQKLSDQEKFEESNQVLMKLLAQNPDNPDVYWKIAQNYYDIGERIDIEKDKAKKLEMYKQCEAWARKGYDKNPGLADNAFWMAVGMSQQAQTNGIAATLLSDRTLAKRIEEFYIKSTQAKDFHYRDKNADTISSAHFALGQFYRKVPSGWYVNLLMGTQGDMNKSVDHARKAVQLYPNNIEYNKELGVSLMCRGERNDDQNDMDEAAKYLEKVGKLPADGALDRIDQKDAKRIIADPSLACGYSRIQQEEVSEGSLKEKENK